MGAKQTSKLSLMMVVQVFMIVATATPVFAYDEDETAAQYFRKEQEIQARLRGNQNSAGALPLPPMASGYEEEAPIARPKLRPSRDARPLEVNDAVEHTSKKLPHKHSADNDPASKIGWPTQKEMMKANDAMKAANVGYPFTVGSKKLPRKRAVEAMAEVSQHDQQPVKIPPSRSEGPVTNGKKVGLKAARAESDVQEIAEKEMAPTAANPVLTTKIRDQGSASASKPAAAAAAPATAQKESAPSQAAAKVAAKTSSSAPATAPAPKTVAAEAAPVVQGPESCAKPEGQLSELAKLGKKTSEALKQGPIVAQTQTIMIDPEDEDYQKGWDDYQKKSGAKPANQSPAHQVPTSQNPFVQKLLKFAKIEASRSCRVLSHGRICSQTGRPKGACLQGVRMAFQRAAGQSTATGWTLNAKDAGRFLPKYGYHKVAISTFKEAPAGSVFIYIDPNNRGRAGHIEIKGTDGYYSDFASKYMINDRRGLGINRQLKEVWVPN